MSKPFEYIRDCIKKSLAEGSRRGHEFQKMRHGIIAELKRLEYSSLEAKGKLLDWNKLCERTLGPSQLRRQLLNYVDWAYACDCKTGCKALEDYCIGKDKCQFYKRTTHSKRRQTKKLPFDLNELERFLTERYRAASYPMMNVIRVLRKHQLKEATGEIIYIGCKKISLLIMQDYKTITTPVDAHRRLSRLIDEGVLECTERGKRGTFSTKANGYRFLSWKPP